MKQILVSLILAVSFSVSICAYAACVQNDVSGSVIRLHIKANSDSEYDQNLKLAVRDAVINRLAPLLSKSDSINESEYIIEENLSLIESTANSVLKNYNTDYSAKARLCTKKFPTKSYQNITLPAGNYRALCIDLGSASGENWWCVMFPPLCLNASTAKITEEGKKYLEQNLNSDSFAIINTNDENFTTVYRFKIFDYISSILN